MREHCIPIGHIASEGMRVNLSIMLAYKLGTSTDDDTKRDQVWDIY
jgi:hypothetical protein